MTNIFGGTGSQQYWSIVAPGAQTLTVSISGGTGDVDLYVRYGAPPTLTAYTCRPYLNGNNEACTLPSAQAGTWYVMLRSYAAYNGVTLVASY